MTPFQAAAAFASGARFRRTRVRHRDRGLATERYGAATIGPLARQVTATLSSSDDQVVRMVEARVDGQVADCASGVADSPYYLPRNKRRHGLSAVYWKAIDPHRPDLTHCIDLCRSSIVLPHTAMLRPEAEEHLPRALAKVSRHAGRLRARSARP
jgi:hypothetical protein